MACLFLCGEYYGMEIDPKYLGKIARMRNLKLYKGATDEEIYQALLKKEAVKDAVSQPINTDTYDSTYRKLFDKLMSDYGVDMNDSNDVEALKMLARHTIQLDGIESHMKRINAQPTLTNEDTRTLKNLGDVQRSIMMSIAELQDRLGISRKARKDKMTDTVPAFIEKLKDKAADYWERTTVPVRCDTCKIELLRYWKNFPQRKSTITAELECPKCGQTILYVG